MAYGRRYLKRSGAFAAPPAGRRRRRRAGRVAILVALAEILRGGGRAVGRRPSRATADDGGYRR